MPVNTDEDKPRSVTSNGTRASAKKKKQRRRRARQWTYLIENLKGSIDALYEVCRTEHSIPGCKEAILYLQDGVRDFETLIETINVEMEYGKEQKAVAWEIRKSMGSPNHVVSEKMGLDHMPLYPMVLAEVIARNASTNADKPKELEKEREKDKPKEENLEKPSKDDDGWKLVTGRRRKSAASSTTASEFADREMSVESNEQNEPPRMNVYERLSGGSSCRRHSTTTPGEKTYATATKSSVGTGLGGNKTTVSSIRLNPKSAMGLPQTKASMAKVAYTRQRLWEKHQPELTEKFKAQQRKERMKEIQSTIRSTSSINFSDVNAARRIAQEFRTQKIQIRQQKSAPASEVNRSLQSITETGEGDEEKPTRAPETPRKASNARNSPIESIPADPVHVHTVASGAKTELKRRSEQIVDELRCSKSEPVRSSLSSSLTPPPLDLEADLEWRELTEEEESLALEEHSLKLVIQREESVSIDAELERQVAAEAEKLEQLERDEEERLRKEKEDEETKKSDEQQQEPQPATFAEMCRKWEAEIAEFASMSWSELMEAEIAGHYHEPGTLVEKREKMNSPSRRRTDRNDSDFSKKHEEKLRRAEELRTKLQEQKAARLRELMQRVEEVRAKREAIIEKKRIHLEKKMERAQINREENIREIVKKAKDDEQKVMEVKFINALQDGNYKQDLKLRDAEIEERRQTIADERTRKIEEKAALALAAEERRKLAEAERQARLQEIAEKREARHSLVLAQKEELEREKKEKRRIQKERQEENRQTVTTPTGERRDEKKRTTIAKLQCRWDSFSDPVNWPSDQKLPQDIKCTACNEIMNSELDAMAHILSASHLAKVKEFRTTTGELEAQVQRYLVEVEPIDRIEEKEEKSETEENKLEKWCLARLPSTTPNCISPRQQNRIAKELSDRLKDIDANKKLSEATSKTIEKKTAELVAICAEKEKFDTIAEQLLASDAVSKLFELTFKGSISESVHKHTSLLLCRLLASPRCVSLIASGTHLMNLLTGILNQLKSEKCNASHLVSLCNLLTITLTTLNDKKNTANFVKENLNPNEMIELVASFLLSSGFISGCKAVLELTKAVEILTALSHLVTQFLAMDNEDCYLLVARFTTTLLESTMEKYRKQSGKDELSNNSNILVKLLYDCANRHSREKTERETVWKTLLSHPPTALRIRLLIGYVLISQLSDEKNEYGKRESKKTTTKSDPLQSARTLQTMLFIRQFAQMGAIFQRLLLAGESIPVTLATRMPLVRLVTAPHNNSVMLTLLDTTYGCEEATRQLANELSVKHFVRFLKKQSSTEKTKSMLEFYSRFI